MRWREVLILVALTILSSAAGAQTLEDLRVGHWVKVKGSLKGAGLFLGEEVELLPPEDEEALTGTVSRRLGPTRYVLLGQPIHLSARTQLHDLESADLTGKRVKVEGHYRGPGKFSAREVALRGEGREAIEGRVNSIDRRGDVFELSIMGYLVRLPRPVVLEAEQPIGEFELAPQALIAAGRLRDDDDDLPGTLTIGPHLTLGGQLETEVEHKRDFDLEEPRRADRTDYEASLRTELTWEPAESFYALAGFEFMQQWREDERRGDSSDDQFRLTEAYGYWRDFLTPGLDLQLGRQDFDERREWLYDQNLDAVRLSYSLPEVRLEFSASTVLDGGDTPDEERTNLIAYVSNNDYRRHAAAYVIDRNNREDSSDHPTHIGGRLLGEWLPQNESWAEFAYLLGQSPGGDLDAYGFDLGTTWTPAAFEPFAFTVGFAHGSGDSDPSDGTDGTFRQTGLQDDNDKFEGVTSFRYYGEVLDPELANLTILTLGVGGRPSPRTSLDLVFHQYHQSEAAPRLVDTDLRRDPDGVHRELGWELDLIFGSRAWKNWHLEVVVGHFQPGAAFPGADPAWLGRFQLRFKF